MNQQRPLVAEARRDIANGELFAQLNGLYRKKFVVLRKFFCREKYTGIHNHSFISCRWRGAVLPQRPFYAGQCDRDGPDVCGIVPWPGQGRLDTPECGFPHKEYDNLLHSVGHRHNGGMGDHQGEYSSVVGDNCSWMVTGALFCRMDRAAYH